ncbi:uncharacterized protein A1O9_03890 [Exophiala aquamarina CBS 119918]|uniref:Uncharacterized protein n=1 Tax=Exophiala aquamarina CBS 119918 TaxID=1182545 RepID=A0A072PH08_9EURO|nr:uncharacterized protein A1O9_03890 [Exophiala aquamarina CBS 119918]KEF59047.1 hypothetical protein A1O9_03890 [Exophiala aquamarina CBS 119918]
MAPFLNDSEVTTTGPGNEGNERLCQIVTPVGNFGNGFVDSQVEAALESTTELSTPTAIILDSGSTDSGPSRLALGYLACPRSCYERDMNRLVNFGVKYKVPLLISSVGGDGSDEHVDEFLAIIRELAQLPENSSWNLKVIAIYAGVTPTRVTERLQSGKIIGCGKTVPELTQKEIDQVPRIVAQMGPEPFLQAMLDNPDFNIIIGGRSYDPSPYIAYAAYNALQKKPGDMYSLGKDVMGSFTHMGKIMECGGHCATPKSNGAIAHVYKNATFDLTPMDPLAKCIPRSVAAHSLYEKPRPDILHGPGGYMNLSNCTFEQLEDGRTVRVSGAVFEASRANGEKYTVKLEAARVMGFRTLFMGSFSDPILISQLDNMLDRIRAYVKMQHKDVTETWDLGFHIYGLNGEAVKASPTFVDRPYAVTQRVFVVGEAIAETQKLATSIANVARVGCVHAPYKGQKATSGNFGFGIGGKLELEVAECAEFCIYHLMSLEDGEEDGVSASCHADGIANTVDGKGLFHWTVANIGQAEPLKVAEAIGSTGTSHTNGDATTTKTKATSILPPTQAFKIPENPRFLADIASVLRSKNAGPYEITVDILFDLAEVYELVKSSGVLTAEKIAEQYKLVPGEMVWSGFFDLAQAFKATFPRKRDGKLRVSGGYLENDVHGSQQYLQLMELKLSDDLREKLVAIQRREADKLASLQQQLSTPPAVEVTVSA